eukprot:17300_1
MSTRKLKRGFFCNRKQEQSQQPDNNVDSLNAIIEGVPDQQSDLNIENAINMHFADNIPTPPPHQNNRNLNSNHSLLSNPSDLLILNSNRSSVHDLQILKRKRKRQYNDTTSTPSPKRRKLNRNSNNKQHDSRHPVHASQPVQMLYGVGAHGAYGDRERPRAIRPNTAKRFDEFFSEKQQFNSHHAPPPPNHNSYAHSSHSHLDATRPSAPRLQRGDIADTFHSIDRQSAPIGDTSQLAVNHSQNHDHYMRGARQHRYPHHHFQQHESYTQHDYWRHNSPILNSASNSHTEPAPFFHPSPLLPLRHATPLSTQHFDINNANVIILQTNNAAPSTDDTYPRCKCGFARKQRWRVVRHIKQKHKSTDTRQFLIE